MSWRDRAIKSSNGSGGAVDESEAFAVPPMIPAPAPPLTPPIQGIQQPSWMDRAERQEETKVPKTLKGLAKNLGTDVADLVKAVPALVKLGLMPPEELGPILKEMVWEGLPHPEFEERGGGIPGEGEIVMKPGAILSRAKDVVTSPIESLYENPLLTPLDVASVAVPALKGTKAGAAISAAEKAAIGKIAAPVKKAAGSVGRKGISAALGPSEEAIAARLTRNAEIVKAKPYEDLAEDLAKSANTLGEQIEKFDTRAWKSLRKSHDPLEGAIPRKEVIDLFQKIKRRVQITGGGAVGEAQRRAIKAIDQIITDAKNVGGKVPGKLKSVMGVKSSFKKSDFFSEAQTKEIIQSMRKNVDFSDDTAELTNRALETASESLDDILKTRNTEYAKRMKPVAERTQALKETQRLFNLEKRPGEGFVPKDVTATKLKGSVRDNKSVTKETLGKVKKYTGKDYLKQAEDYGIAEEFMGGRTQGSRRVNLGAFLGGGAGALTGGGAGGAVGAIGGAMTGAYLDRQGARIAGQIIDQIVKRRTLRSAGQGVRSIAPTPLRELLYLTARAQPQS